MVGFAVSFAHAVSLAVLGALEARGLHRADALATAIEETEPEAVGRLRRLAGGGDAYPAVMADVAVLATVLRLPLDITVTADGSHGATAAAGSLPWAAAGDALAARCESDGMWDAGALEDATGLERDFLEELIDQVHEGRAPIGDVAVTAHRLGIALTVSVRIDADVVIVDGAE
jgi:hypothetical protein